MDYLIGLGLALALCAAAGVIGFDRERVFYPMMLIVIASYYVLFAAMGGAQALLVESVVAMLFLAIAVIGFKRNLWLVVAALAAHGVFDFVHGHLVENAGVPTWWPAFCLAFDLAAALWLGALLVKRAGAVGKCVFSR